MMKNYETAARELREKLSVLTGGSYEMGPWLPCRVQEHLCEQIFLYSGTGKKRNRPYLSVLINSQTGAVLELRNAYVNDFVDGEKYPLGGVMDYSVPTARTAAEQGELLKKLNGLYGVVRTFAFADDPTQEQQEVLRDYAHCLEDAVPAALTDFCRDAQPEFFRWMETYLARP